MSSVWDSSHSYDADQAIDGRMDTICATGLAVGSWLSVRVLAGTPIGRVMVHNRRDEYNHLLGSFEIWLGSSFGDTASGDAVLCGGASFDAASEPSPYVVECGGVARSFVTLKRVGPAGYVAIAELEPYIAPHLPPLSPATH